VSEEGPGDAASGVDPLPGVLTAVTGAPWEGTFIAALAAMPSRLRVARRCVDVADLLAAASAGHGQVAFVAGDLPRFDHDTVLQLGSAGVAVVGVAAGDSPEEGLLRCGVSEIVAPDDDAETLVAAITRARTTLQVPDPTTLADPNRARSHLPAGGAPMTPGSRHGQLIAVWGPSGAPGRTTVAVAIAAEAARLGQQVLLVDADTYGGAVAQTLGLLDESPGVVAACRSAGVGALDEAVLMRHARTVSGGLRVLTGITRTSRWPELRPVGLETVFRLARRSSDLVVVDCGFGLEQDEELSFDTAAPRRNGATLAALTLADAVLAIGRADPIGMHRLVRGLDDLGDVVPETVVRVVVNRVRRSVVGADPEQQITTALHRYAGVGQVTCVPDDPAALDLTLRHGRTLDEVAAGAPARHALRGLAAELVDAEPPAPRRERAWARRRRARAS